MKARNKIWEKWNLLFRRQTEEEKVSFSRHLIFHRVTLSPASRPELTWPGARFLPNISYFSYFCVCFSCVRQTLYDPFGIVYYFLYSPTSRYILKIDATVIEYFAFSRLVQAHLAYWTVCVGKPFHKIYVRLAYQKDQHAWAICASRHLQMKRLTHTWFTVPIPRSSVKLCWQLTKKLKTQLK